MNDLKIISVIVPVYNVECYLRECLDSILNQSYSNLEIILIDDGSTDHSGNICDEYALKDNRIKVVHQSNQGLSCARNAGLDIASGDYVGFVDSDDYIDRRMYELLFEHADQNNLDFISCNRVFVSDNSAALEESDCSAGSVQIYCGNILKEVADGNVPGTSVFLFLFKKQIFDDIRFLPGRYFEDYEILPRLAYTASRVGTIDAPLYYYRVRNASIMHSNYTRKKYLDKTNEDVVNFYRLHNPESLPKVLAQYLDMHLVAIYEAYKLKDCEDLIDNSIDIIKKIVNTEVVQYNKKLKLKIFFLNLGIIPYCIFMKFARYVNREKY